ncbi:MAG: hypothetical protein OIF56_15540 [Cohaesibacter sp.]|nr:hypothetical protein [Cohaesibacter sp.]MCV6601915.1 hypothetical protein [Cohaesibacter sp.]
MSLSKGRVLSFALLLVILSGVGFYSGVSYLPFFSLALGLAALLFVWKLSSPAKDTLPQDQEAMAARTYQLAQETEALLASETAQTKLDRGER